MPDNFPLTRNPDEAVNNLIKSNLDQDTPKNKRYARIQERVCH